MSCEPAWTFAIDGHKFTVIEADGVNTLPLVVDSLTIYTGQRYSLILNADQDIGNYWMRASPNLGDQGFLGGINSAILHYIGSSNANPTSMPAISLSPLLESHLHALENPGALGLPFKGGADVVLDFNFTVDLTIPQFFVNGASFVPPTVPVLLQILSGAHTATDLLPAGNVYLLPKNKVIEVTLHGMTLAGPVRVLCKNLCLLC